MRRVAALVGYCTWIAPALATELNIAAQSGSASSVTVAPGAIVNYVIKGRLGSTGDNEGLAGIFFDLAFSGGPIAPVAPPGVGPMLAFVPPNGVANPGGYGGTPALGRLLQVGGMQNVFNNTPTSAPEPVGVVATNVGHNDTILATGSLTAPMTAGTYTLAISNVVAAVIKGGSTGVPTWPVQRTEGGTIANLEVTVSLGPVAGACCTPSGCTEVTAAECTNLAGTFAGDGTSCLQANCPAVIPTASAWGLVIITLGLLTGAKLRHIRSRAAL